MLKVIGVVDDKYTVLDTDDSVEETISAEGLVLAISDGVEFEGCEYGEKGLRVWYDGVEPYDVDIEVWKPVWFVKDGTVFHANSYRVSNLGRVVYCGRGDTAWRFRNQQKTERDYRKLGLSVNGVWHNVFVHRLVAFAFVPNPMGYLVVNHKDEVPSNNCAYNLEWCTQKYNCNYGTRPKQISDAVSKAVRMYSLSGELVSEYHSCLEASKVVGCSFCNISSSCLSKTLRALDAVWRYVDDDELFAMSVNERAKLFQSQVSLIRQYDIYGNLISDLRRPSDIAREIGSRPGHVSACCRRDPLYYVCNGYVLRYCFDDELFELSVGERKSLIYASVSKKVLNRYRGVRQYSFTGALVAEFSSVFEASLVTGVTKGCIYSCCNGDYNTGEGFMWRYVDEDDLEGLSELERSMKVRSVRQYTEDGLFISEYESATSAGKSVGVTVYAISHCCLGRVKLCRGFIWRYSDNDEFANRPENRALIEEFYKNQLVEG